MTAKKPVATTRRTAIDLAKPGQLRGITVPNPAIDEDYEKASGLARQHPTLPVIVHEYPFTEATKDAVRREASHAAQQAMGALNDPSNTATDTVEPFHAGYALGMDEPVYRTFVRFYPHGRPRLERNRKPRATIEHSTESVDVQAGAGDLPFRTDAEIANLPSGSSFVHPEPQPRKQTAQHRPLRVPGAETVPVGPEGQDMVGPDANPHAYAVDSDEVHGSADDDPNVMDQTSFMQ